MMSEVTLVQELVATTNIFGDGAEGCFGGDKCPRSGFGLDLRPVFQWPQAEAEEEKQDVRRRSIRRGQGRKPFLGGSDPVLRGFSAAQRLRRRGVATAQVYPADLLAPSPADL